MRLLPIGLVIMGVFFLAAEGVNLGSCKNCGCVNPLCDWPKTEDECNACAKAAGRGRTSMEGGHCWVLVDPTSEGSCALRTFSKLSGCSGFSGYTHYGGGNKNCWATWRPAGGRKRRDVSDSCNAWNGSSL